MPWLTHRVLRKEASFKLVPNEWFNLETKTGIRGWNSPKFVISVNKYYSSFGTIDTMCKIIPSTYPTFYLSNVERMEAGSEITVYVIEGNEDTINYNLNAGWTETFRIRDNNIYQAEINAGNNWTINVPSNFIGKEYDVLYFIKSVYFDIRTFFYEFISTKNANNTLSTQLNCRKGVILEETNTSNSYSATRNKVVYWCLNFTGVFGTGTGTYNNTIVVYVNGVRYDFPSSSTAIKPVILQGSNNNSLSFSYSVPNNASANAKHILSYLTTTNYTTEQINNFSAIITLIKKGV